jgi:hypothetical protein
MDITSEFSFELDERQIARAVAYELDLSELAGEIDIDDLADNISLESIADYVDVSYDELSERVVESDDFMDHVVARFCLKSLEENPSYILFINKIVEDVKVAIDAEKVEPIESVSWYDRMTDQVRKGFERLTFKKFDTDYEYGRITDDKSDTHRLGE